MFNVDYFTLTILPYYSDRDFMTHLINATHVTKIRCSDWLMQVTWLVHPWKMEVKKQVVKPSVWNLLERKIAPLWVNDDREDVILAKIQKEEAEERELAKATRETITLFITLIPSAINFSVQSIYDWLSHVIGLFYSTLNICSRMDFQDKLWIVFTFVYPRYLKNKFSPGSYLTFFFPHTI